MKDMVEFKCQIKLDEKKKKSKNKIYNNKHQIIHIMLCNRIILYSYILLASKHVLVSACSETLSIFLGKELIICIYYNLEIYIYIIFSNK